MKTMLLLGAVIPVVAAGRNPDDVLLYKTVGDTELRLHVFQPDGHQETDKRPAIVFFFGGGWTGGTPKQFYQQAAFFADKGLVCFSAEYRVKSRNRTTPFECVKDGKSAIRWVRQHAAELGVDADRIVAAGGSAGGHVAACTGLIEGCEEAGDELAVSSRPNAMMLYNPVLDTTSKGFGAGRFKPEQQTDLSPCHQVRAGLAPTLVFHGTADTTVPFENAERFTRLMMEAGNRCELKAFEGEAHGFFNSTLFRPKADPAIYDQVMAAGAAFLQSLGYLKE